MPPYIQVYNFNKDISIFRNPYEYVSSNQPIIIDSNIFRKLVIEAKYDEIEDICDKYYIHSDDIKFAIEIAIQYDDFTLYCGFLPDDYGKMAIYRGCKNIIQLLLETIFVDNIVKYIDLIEIAINVQDVNTLFLIMLNDDFDLTHPVCWYILNNDIGEIEISDNIFEHMNLMYKNRLIKIFINSMPYGNAYYFNKFGVIIKHIPYVKRYVEQVIRNAKKQNNDICISWIRNNI